MKLKSIELSHFQGIKSQENDASATEYHQGVLADYRRGGAINDESGPYRVYAWIYAIVGIVSAFLTAFATGDAPMSTGFAGLAISAGLLLASATLISAARKIDDLQADCQELEEIIKSFDDETNTEIVFYTLPGEDAQ